MSNTNNKLYANNMTSSLLIHPGEMIKDEIEARGITQKDLAEKMGVSYTVFNEILNGKRPVTTEYALLLEAALGIDAGIWLRMQADYNMQKAKADKTFMNRLEHIRRYSLLCCKFSIEIASRFHLNRTAISLESQPDNY